MHPNYLRSCTNVPSLSFQGDYLANDVQVNLSTYEHFSWYSTAILQSTDAIFHNRTRNDGRSMQKHMPNWTFTAHKEQKTSISELYENITKTDNRKTSTEADNRKNVSEWILLNAVWNKHFTYIWSVLLEYVRFYWVEIKRTSADYRVPRVEELLHIWPNGQTTKYDLHSSTSKFHWRPHSLCTTTRPLTPLASGYSLGCLEGGWSEIFGNYLPVDTVSYPRENLSVAVIISMVIAVFDSQTLKSQVILLFFVLCWLLHAWISHLNKDSEDSLTITRLRHQTRDPITVEVKRLFYLTKHSERVLSH